MACGHSPVQCHSPSPTYLFSLRLLTCFTWTLVCAHALKLTWTLSGFPLIPSVVCNHLCRAFHGFVHRVARQCLSFVGLPVYYYFFNVLFRPPIEVCSKHIATEILTTRPHCAGNICKQYAALPVGEFAALQVNRKCTGIHLTGYYGSVPARSFAIMSCL